MSQVLLVGAGGFIGALLRYALNSAIQRLTHNASFPYGTLVINLSGCLVIGLLSYLADARSAFTPEARAFVFIGILGAYTTFSTFGNETVGLAREGQTLLALINIGAHIVFGLGAVWAGRALAGAIWR